MRLQGLFMRRWMMAAATGLLVLFAACPAAQAISMDKGSTIRDQCELSIGPDLISVVAYMPDRSRDRFCDVRSGPAPGDAPGYTGRGRLLQPKPGPLVRDHIGHDRGAGKRNNPRPHAGPLASADRRASDLRVRAVGIPGK